MVMFKALDFSKNPKDFSRILSWNNGMQDDMRAPVSLLHVERAFRIIKKWPSDCWNTVSFLLQERLDINCILLNICLSCFVTSTHPFCLFFYWILVFFLIICMSSLQEHWSSISHICCKYFLSFYFIFFYSLWNGCVTHVLILLLNSCIESLGLFPRSDSNLNI